MGNDIIDQATFLQALAKPALSITEVLVFIALLLLLFLAAFIASKLYNKTQKHSSAYKNSHKLLKRLSRKDTPSWLKNWLEKYKKNPSINIRESLFEEAGDNPLRLSYLQKLFPSHRRSTNPILFHSIEIPQDSRIRLKLNNRDLWLSLYQNSEEGLYLHTHESIEQGDYSFIVYASHYGQYRLEATLETKAEGVVLVHHEKLSPLRRRKFRRYPVSFHGHVDAGKTYTLIPARIQDLSLGGAKLLIPHLPQKLQKVKVRLFTHHDRQLELGGKILNQYYDRESSSVSLQLSFQKKYSQDWRFHALLQKLDWQDH